MENNHFEKDRLNFLSKQKFFCNKKLPEALSLAEERLTRFPLDVDARVIAGNVFIGMGRIDESRNILREVEKIISGLSLIYVRMADTYGEKGLNRTRFFAIRSLFP